MDGDVFLTTDFKQTKGGCLMAKKNGGNRGVANCAFCGGEVVGGVCLVCNAKAVEIVDTQKLPVDPALTAVLDARMKQKADDKDAADKKAADEKADADAKAVADKAAADAKVAAEKQAATEKAIADAKAKVAAQAATADKAKADAEALVKAALAKKVEEEAKFVKEGEAMDAAAKKVVKLKPEPKPAPKPESKPEPKVEPKPEPKSEPAPYQMVGTLPVWFWGVMGGAAACAVIATLYVIVTM